MAGSPGIFYYTLLPRKLNIKHESLFINIEKPIRKITVRITAQWGIGISFHMTTGRHY
jgi:hypothetical protein